jgi:uncharacterized protein (DUF2237 family)
VKHKLNILGTELVACCFDPLTGYFRDGYCQTDQQDHGTHTVCAEVTEEFLSFSLSRGNDLITPNPDYNFPGLKPGDFWCLCVMRWHEAYQAGVAPKIKLEASQHKTLSFVSIDILKEFAL